MAPFIRLSKLCWTKSGIQDSKLRVIIHALDSSAVIERGDDFALEATVLLNRSVDKIVSELSGDDRSLFERLAQAFDFAVDTRSYYRALLFVRDHEELPWTIDRLLHRLALKGDLIYRSFSRGSTFKRGRRSGDPSALNEALAAFNTRLAQFSARLKDMIQYAELGSDRGLCRSAFLANYLTGSASSTTVKCGKCDLCSPAYPVPWSLASVIAPEPLPVEPMMAILELVRDDASSRSINTLIKILLGERYGGRGDTRYRISAYARNSEQFGILQGKITREQLSRYFEVLFRDGFLILCAANA